MSTGTYDTKEAQQKQGVSFDEQDWLRLQQHLPADWQEQARIKNAWTRTRNLRSIADLLRALLVYAACGFSFRDLSIWGTLTGLASVSECAWLKRLATASPWIDWLVATLIGPGCTPPWLPKNHGGRILQVAKTGPVVVWSARQNLGTGADVRASVFTAVVFARARNAGALSAAAKNACGTARGRAIGNVGSRSASTRARELVLEAGAVCGADGVSATTWVLDVATNTRLPARIGSVSVLARTKQAATATENHVDLVNPAKFADGKGTCFV